MSETSVKIAIANRTYPLKIKLEEEANVRNAEATINNLINGLEKNYQITDKQDLLSMSLIKMATELEKLRTENSVSTAAFETEVEMLTNKLDTHLNENVL